MKRFGIVLFLFFVGLILVGCNRTPKVIEIVITETEITVEMGDTYNITPSLLNAVGGEVLVYTSSNTSIFTVASGLITPVSVGSANLTISIVDSTSSVTIPVTVTEAVEPVEELTSITVTPSTIDFVLGSSPVLITVSGNIEVTNDMFNFTSSDEAIATVSTEGYVVGIRTGTVTINVVSKDDAEINATVSVTVEAVALPPTLSFEVETITIEEGKTAALSYSIANVSDNSVTFTSSDETKATVSSAGVLTGVAQGTATITITSVSDSSLTDTCVVTVIESLSLPKVLSYPPTVTLAVGQNATLDKLTRNLTDTSVTWSSSNSSYVTVDSTGKIAGIAVGSATITATSVENTSVTGTTLVTVIANTTSGLTLSPSVTSIIEVGDAGHQMYVKNTSGTSISRLECTFTTSDANVATVSTYGTITAKAVGLAIINATHPTFGSGMIVLNIVEPMAIPGLMTISASPSGFIPLDTTNTFQLSALDYLSNSVPNNTCTFESNPMGIVSISSEGVLQALAVGVTTITVTHPTFGVGTIIITVEGAAVAPLTTLSSWVPSQTVSTYALGYGVAVSKYLGQTKDPASTTMHNQEVSVMHVDNSQDSKVIVWRKRPNNYGWQLATVPALAADYEVQNPTMKVIAAINADFFDISANGNLPYQTTGATVCEGENYKTTVGNTTAYKTIGFTNDGTTNTLVAGTPDRALTLSIYNSSGVVTETIPVDKINALPGAGEVSLYYALWNAEKQIVPVNLDGGSANVYTVGSGTTVLANSATDFYGKGSISSTATTTTLTQGQFSIVSNDSAVNSILTTSTTIKVQYEYSGAFANVKNATGGTRGFILDNTIVDPAVCIASRSDLGARHPRTLIGKKADGTIVMVAVSGRAEPDRYGVGVEAMQAIMAYYYCVDAYNLDGGGSTTMIVRTGTAYGTANSFTTVNTVAGGILRADGNAILVVAPR